MTDTQRKNMIITIDGPSGAGKSTVARLLAKSLGYTYIDTGAMYRGVAYAFLKAGKPGNMAEFLKGLPIRFTLGDGMEVFLNGKDVSGEIRSPEVSLLASTLSQDRSVREYLWEIQRDIGKKGRVVLEGRDTGSVVFPHAHVKFYIDANLEERGKRRFLELAAKGVTQERSSVKAEMEERDRNDSERSLAPLVVPQGAIRIDTTGIGPAEVVDIMVRHVSEAGG